MRNPTKIALFILALLVYGCAQINPLSGGGKDTTAPQIDSARTYPLSGHTNFTGSEIRIKFDEYISLNNPNENIIITPQLKEKPSFQSHNKKLSIVFNETLEENTTYTISFNGAIQDITEKNDSIFQFVFSTGDYIDSLILQGKVKDAFTNQGAANFLIAMYPVKHEIEFDSIPYKIKPTYIGQTDKAGNFKLSYLKEGDYYVFAIEDKNKNLILDKGESFGFLNEQLVHINPETEPILIKSFQQEDVQELRINETRFTYPGKIEFILSAPDSVMNFSVSTSMELLQESTGRADSLVYWLSNNPTAKMQFYTNLNNEVDTIKPLYKGIPERGKEPDVSFTSNIVKEKLAPGQDLELTFSEPILRFNPDAIHFYDKDSTELKLAESTKNVRTIKYATATSTATYAIVDSGYVKSIFGATNESEKIIRFETLDSSFFGSLILNIDTTYSDPVLVELINDKNERVQLVAFSDHIEFDFLKPGNYRLRLIFDENSDGSWTTGSLKDLRLPENVVYYIGEINIKSKWEKEIDWILKQEKDGGS